MNLTRRDLAAAGFALSATTLIVPAMAATDDQETVRQAVEALRKAILAQDRPKLETLTAEQLSYSHSSARVLRRGTKSSACLPSTISGGSHWSASRLIRSHRRRRPSPSAGDLRHPGLGELHRPPPARALIEGVGFAADSPLEGTGFELSVPLGRATASNRLLSRCYPRACHPREHDFGCPLEPEAEGQRGPRACFTIG